MFVITCSVNIILCFVGSSIVVFTEKKEEGKKTIRSAQNGETEACRNGESMKGSMANTEQSEHEMANKESKGKRDKRHTKTIYPEREFIDSLHSCLSFFVTQSEILLCPKHGCGCNEL